MKGYPDFFGYSIFPHFGSTESTVVAYNTYTGASYDLINVVSKGIYIGGYLRVDTWTDLLYLNLSISIDGTTLFNEPIADMVTMSLFRDDKIGAKVTTYDLYNKIVEISFRSDFSFGDTLIINLANSSSPDPFKMSSVQHHYQLLS